MSEKPKYRPEDVLETKGIDKGRIKDVELAQSGAETEQQERLEAKEIIDATDSPSDIRRGEEKIIRADQIGGLAMIGEIEKIKGEEVGSYGVDDEEFINTEARDASENFIATHTRLKRERKEEAKQRYLDDQGKNETSE